MFRRGKRATFAALVILVLGITANLGPCEHDCSSHDPSSGPELPSRPVLEAPHAEQEHVLCVDCLLEAQFESLGLSVVRQVLPPQDGIVVGTLRGLLLSDRPWLHGDARAPPYASPDPHTV